MFSDDGDQIARHQRGEGGMQKWFKLEIFFLKKYIRGEQPVISKSKVIYYADRTDRRESFATMTYLNSSMSILVCDYPSMLDTRYRFT